VEVETDGRVLSVPPRERSLLGVLLLDANRVVPVDRLADFLWDGEQPKRVRGAVQGYVSRLRNLLSDGDGIELIFASGGYRLVVDPETVDAHQFRGLLARAARTADPAERLKLLRTALDLWRGPALADAASGWARERLCSDLEEERLAATEDLASLRLALRREREVLPELARIAGENPGRESLIGLQMRALYQAGRRVDALDVYTRARIYLGDELGIDPGPQLRELHQAILRDELDQPPPTMSSADHAPSGSVVPRQLPAEVTSFTGRIRQLADLDGLLAGQEDTAASVVISAIGGTAGVGKTALAVHWAHRVAGRFPDGQLFIDLHGFTTAVAPVEPADALERMLRALDIPGSRIPVELDDRAALWRSVLSGRHMLVVLDNAATVAQVAPLLPGTPGCLVLVTSRRRLAGLDPTYAVSLDMLPLADALTLFTRTVGAERIAGQARERVVEAVELCGRLPLAIRIAAARLRSRPAWSVTDLVERLRDEEHRLAELEDGARGVATALDVSYQQLAAEQQRVYRLLGLHPGRDIDVYAAAALADIGVARARRCLDQLLDANMLQEPTAGRLAFHDLVRAHAASTVTDQEAEAPRRAAVERLLDYYRHTAWVATNAAYPYAKARRPSVPPASTACPDVSNIDCASAWLDVELPNLLTAAEHAASNGWPTYTRHLSTVLNHHLRWRGHYRYAETLHERSLTTARAVGHSHGELTALIHLGSIHVLQGRHGQALSNFGQALVIARTAGDPADELTILSCLGTAHSALSQHEQARNRFQQALGVARRIGDIAGEPRPLTGIGHVHRLQGRYEEALDNYREALRIARSTDNRATELDAMIGVSSIYFQQGRDEQALSHYRLTFALADAMSSHIGRLSALLGLGHVHLRRGRYEEAAHHYQQVLDDALEIGSDNWQFEARLGLGRLQQTIGHPEAALAQHDQALQLAKGLGNLTDQARAHDGTAHAHHALNQPEPARRHWLTALHILGDLGIESTEDHQTNALTIRANLARLDTVTFIAPTRSRRVGS
jgi:DNA-binding SARP family transcriptional activator/tetratricopeptide (TPR) repeat protein